MGANGRYVKPASRTIVPAVVFAVDVHPYRSRPRGPEGMTEETWGSADVAVVRRRKDRWSAPEWAKVTTPEALREWMEERASDCALNWVIAHSVTDALTLSKWWDYAKSRNAVWSDRKRAQERADDRAGTDCGMRITEFVCGGPPDIVGYTDSGRRWRWVSGSNYWPCGPGDGGAVDRVGGEHADARDSREDGTHAAPDCGACALVRRFVSLCEWWRGVATARLAPTASGLAWGVLRSHLPPRSLVQHDCDDTHRLERACALGGRASVWFYGRVGERVCQHAGRGAGAGALPVPTVPGPVHSLDVRSMYPALLRDRTYPVAPGPTYGAIAPDDLVGIARSEGVLARVTVETRVPEYPRRTPTGTEYPVGRWVACLAGPEIVALADRPGDGAILECHQVATYRMGTPFRDAMAALLEARERAADESGRTFAKLVANSLAGRLAMRIGAWKRCPELDGEREWGEEWLASASTTARAKCRWIMGACWSYDPEREPRGPHTSAFAYLTAYGRVMMRELRDKCPPKSVYAQHTDGLYCSADALRSLSDEGMLRGEGAGALRLVGSADSAQFWGASHYRYGEQWILAGYASAHVSEEKGVVYVSRDASFFGAHHTQAPTSVHRSRVAVSLPTHAEGCQIGPDGWALPALAVKRKRAKGG